MKKIAYQTPVIKTLTSEVIMQGGSTGNGVTGTGAAELGSGGIDNTEEGMDADAKTFGNRSVWDD